MHENGCKMHLIFMNNKRQRYNFFLFIIDFLILSQVRTTMVWLPVTGESVTGDWESVWTLGGYLHEEDHSDIVGVTLNKTNQHLHSAVTLIRIRTLDSWKLNRRGQRRNKYKLWPPRVFLKGLIIRWNANWTLQELKLQTMRVNI